LDALAQSLRSRSWRELPLLFPCIRGHPFQKRLIAVQGVHPNPISS
jgi:hypothetical protein